MNQRHILVVDDDPDVCAMLGFYLKDEAPEISFASDGMTCMARAQRDRPDLIVLDLGLPAGDGLTTLQRLRDVPHLSSIPVIVLTGREGDQWEEEALRAGASAYLRKPVSRGTLLEAVHQVLPPAAEPPQGGLKCSHCGHDVADVTVRLDPASIQAIARAMQSSALV